MKKTSGSGNQGIIMTGGTVKDCDLAVGYNAHIMKSDNVSETNEAVFSELRAELKALTEKMAQLQASSEQAAAAKLAQEELDKDTPNVVLVKTVLGSVADSIQSISGFASHVLSIKKLLDTLIL